MHVFAARLTIISAVMALAIPRAAQSQRLVESRFASTPLTATAASTPLQVATKRLPLWPFIVLGALGGGAYAAHWYGQKVRAADGWGNPVVATLAIGTGVAGGAIIGTGVGLAVRELRR